MVGVRSLSIGLSVALVVCTGVLVGVMSITNGNELLDDARSFGSKALSEALDSADADIQRVVGRYLTSVTTEVEAKFLQVFGKVELILSTGKHMLRGVTPQEATGFAEDNTFLNKVMRTYLATSLRANFEGKTGIEQLSYRGGNDTFSQWHFVATPFQVTARVGPQGPETPYAVISTTDVFKAPSAFQPYPGGPNPEYPLGIPSGEYEINNRPSNPPGYFILGEADRQGNIIPATDRSCFYYKNISKINPVVNLNTMDWGRCFLPASTFPKAPQTLRLEEETFMNAWSDDAVNYPLSDIEDGALVYGPVVESYSWLSMQMSMVVTPDQSLYSDFNNGWSKRKTNRLGYLTAIVDMIQVGEILGEVSTPAGATIYVVDKNPLTGHVGQLVATTTGDLTQWTVVKTPIGVDVHLRVPVNATQHTKNNSSPELSLVGYNAKEIEESGKFPGTYAEVAIETTKKEKFIEWVHPVSSSKYWYTVSHFKQSNLNWFVTMVVERHSIMAQIDESVAQIRVEELEAISDANAKQETSLIITCCVVITVAVLLLALSVLTTSMILAPLDKLGDDMECVATMHVELVDLSQPLSKLSEVKSMQRSFKQMVLNLMEYKQYMPASVLISDGEDDATVDTNPVSFFNSVADSSQHSKSALTSKAGNSSIQQSMMSQQIQKAIDFTTKKKIVTVVLYNLRGWHAISKPLSDKQCQSIYEGFLNCLLNEFAMRKGVADSFSGDHILVAHNAFCNQSTHKVAGLQAAVRARDALASTCFPNNVKLSVSWAAASGESKIGQMGCNGMKKVTMTSAVIPWVHVLESYNNLGNYVGTIDKSVSRDVGGQFQLRQLHVGRFAKRYPNAPESNIDIFEVLSAVEAGEDEWMYQMNEAENANPYTAWNSIFALMAQEGSMGEVREIVEAAYEKKLITDTERDRTLDLGKGFAPITEWFYATGKAEGQ